MNESESDIVPLTERDELSLNSNLINSSTFASTNETINMGNKTPINTENIDEEFDTDDEYDLSDDSDILQAIGGDMSEFHLKYSSVLGDNTSYLVETMNDLLDSVKLDNPLAIQTNTSGRLNHKNQKILEKSKILEEKRLNLKSLYDKYFEIKYDKSLNKNISRIEALKLNISDIESRIEKLTFGHHNNSKNLFRFKQKQRSGVSNDFPIEFNQAKDKVLERNVS